MPERIKIKKKQSKSRMREILHILREHNIVAGLTPEKLRLILEAMGPTFVKLGQIMSMRSDMLPRSYCAELKKLRSSASPITVRKTAGALSSANCPWGWEALK